MDKFENLEKAAMSLALATLSKDTTLNKYSILPANNSNIYSIKSDKHGLYFFIDFNNPVDYDEVLQSLLIAMAEERKLSHTPKAEDLDSYRKELNCLRDIFNTYLAPNSDSTVDFLAQKQDMKYVTSSMEQLLSLMIGANILNCESQTLFNANKYLHYLSLHSVSSPNKAITDDSLTLLSLHSKDQYEFSLNELKKQHPWIESPVNGEDTDCLNNNIAKILTYCLLSNDVKVKIDNTKPINNLFSITGKTSSGALISLDLHNRECMQSDFLRFKNKLFDSIFTCKKIQNAHNLPLKDKEKIFVSLIKNPANSDAFIKYYEGCMDSRLINFNKDQKIFGAIILNLMSIKDYVETCKHDPDTEPLSYETMEDMFDHNYAEILDHPTLPLHLCKKTKTVQGPKKQQPQSLVDEITEFLKSQFPGAEIHLKEVEDISEIQDYLSNLPIDEPDENIDDDLDEENPNIL